MSITTVKKHNFFSIADTELGEARKVFDDAYDTYVREQSEENRKRFIEARSRMWTVEHEQMEARRLLLAHLAGRMSPLASAGKGDKRGVQLKVILYVIWVCAIILCLCRLLGLL